MIHVMSQSTEGIKTYWYWSKKDVSSKLTVGNGTFFMPGKGFGVISTRKSGLKRDIIMLRSSVMRIKVMFLIWWKGENPRMSKNWSIVFSYTAREKRGKNCHYRYVEPFINTCRKRFPRARINHDRFHLVHYLKGYRQGCQKEVHRVEKFSVCIFKEQGK